MKQSYTRGDAREAYESLGWGLSHEQGPHLLTNYASGDLSIARIQSGRGDYESHGAERAVRGILVVEGHIDGWVDAESIVIETGTFALLDGEAPTFGSTRDYCARFYFEIGGNATDLIRDTGLRSAFGEVFTPTSLHRHAITQVCNLVLNQAESTRSRPPIEFGAVLGHLIRGIILDHQHRTADPTDLHRSNLLAEAHSLIDEHFRDPAFDVTSLAQRLRLSDSSLRRLFRTVDSTPSQEIRRRRVGVAKALLALRVNHSAGAADEVAEAAGFTSRVHMWRTLGRESAGS